MGIKVRGAQDWDLSKIVAFYGPVGDSPTDPFSSVDRLRKLDLSGMFVAEFDGQFAGFLYYYVYTKPWFDPEVENYAHIVEVHTLPEFRNKGVATKMVMDAVRHIRARGVETIYVDTGADNAIALHIYRKLGFRDLRKTLTLKKGS